MRPGVECWGRKVEFSSWTNTLGLVDPRVKMGWEESGAAASGQQISGSECGLCNFVSCGQILVLLFNICTYGVVGNIKGVNTCKALRHLVPNKFIVNCYYSCWRGKGLLALILTHMPWGYYIVKCPLPSFSGHTWTASAVDLFESLLGHL